jgi:hypothetical protein
MKKLFLILLVSVVVMSAFFGFSSIAQAADPLVTCGGTGQPRCEFSDLLDLVGRVFNFLLYDIATPLAAALIVAGGVVMTVSAGNPAWIAKGKNMVIWSIIAWVLILTSWIIVDTVLKAIGYKGGVGKI